MQSNICASPVILKRMYELNIKRNLKQYRSTRDTSINVQATIKSLLLFIGSSCFWKKFTSRPKSWYIKTAKIAPVWLIEIKSSFLMSKTVKQ